MNPEFRVFSSSDGYAWMCPFCKEKGVVKIKGEIPDNPAIVVKPIFDHVFKSHPEKMGNIDEGMDFLEKNVENASGLDAKLLRMTVDMWKKSYTTSKSQEFG